MKTSTILLILGVGVVGIGAFFLLGRRGGVGSFTLRNPFGPPTGADINQRPGPPQSPLAGSVGREVQQIQTGIDGAVGLAKDIGKGVEFVKGLFN